MSDPGADPLPALLLYALARGRASIDVRLGGLHVRLDVAPDEGAPPPALPPGSYLAFSPLESEIVAGLRGRGWLSTATLAQTLGYDPASDFRTVVRNLSERGVVETSTKHGVRLIEKERPGE